GHDQLHVALLLLRVHVEHARLLDARHHTELAALHPGGQADLQRRRLATLLLALQAVDVAQGEQAHVIDRQGRHLGFHLRRACHAHRGQHTAPFIALLLIGSRLVYSLAHDVRHRPSLAAYLSSQHFRLLNAIAIISHTLFIIRK
ncbi:MAG: hypothetical protein IK144_00875, partial [Bacteroidaceae bacterium]|nr:hypothetical protein [Bacteroidaceae bacterium]